MKLSPGGDSGLPEISGMDRESSFSESLAEYVGGVVVEQETGFLDGEEIFTSVIWIPTYYGYHSFMGVLDNYILNHTTITSLRTWRLEDRNFYVIHLSQKNLSVRIIYDSRDSLLMLSLPPGY
ncbi:MAG: hypothetical protein R6U58_05505 [Bacteroidales bacterium]